MTSTNSYAAAMQRKKNAFLEAVSSTGRHRTNHKPQQKHWSDKELETNQLCIVFY